MAFQVNTNVSALQVYNNLGVHQSKAADSLARISSGLKSAGAGDIASQGAAAVLSAAQLATASDITNVQNQINALQSADAVYAEGMALAAKGIQVGSSVGNAGADTTAITAQLVAMTAGMVLLSAATYNGAALLGTTFTSTIAGGLTPAAIAAVGTNDTAGYTAAAAAIADLRATNGGNIAMLQNALQVLQSISANELAGLGQAQDTDIATEMMDLTSANIMTEAATAMLAQAMQLPNNVLKLLQ